MHILSSILFALSSNTDNFTIGIAYGIKKLRINIISNIMIAIISCIGTFASMYFGKIISRFMPEYMANYLGSIFLILIGVYGIITSLKESYNRSTKFSYSNLIDNPENVDFNNSGCIDFKESVVLGISLTINNIATGIGASIAGLNIIVTCILTFLFSIAFISLGYNLGLKFLYKTSTRNSGIISGLIILCIGVYEFFI
ncbi:MAG: sporulation membrane protein YtaF [Bacillota bacterium]|nr:sporulation membrane protein YtaF [Bacillota bacterium]